MVPGHLEHVEDCYCGDHHDNGTSHDQLISTCGAMSSSTVLLYQVHDHDVQHLEHLRTTGIRYVVDNGTPAALEVCYCGDHHDNGTSHDQDISTCGGVSSSYSPPIRS